MFISNLYWLNLRVETSASYRDDEQSGSAGGYEYYDLLDGNGCPISPIDVRRPTGLYLYLSK